MPSKAYKLYDVYMDYDRIETLVTRDPGTVQTWINNTEIYQKCRLHRLIVVFDIEWRPNVHPGCQHPVATLQLCVGNSCLIFQILHAPNIPRLLRGFLGNSEYTFVGVGIRNDVKRLLDEYNLEVSNIKDLRSWAAIELDNKKLRTVGLKGLVKEVIGKDLEKPENITRSG